MVEKLKDYLIGIAIGIRYRANFSIEDQLGKIVDQILYSKNSYFNPKVFPEVYNNINEKVLINKSTNDHLVINNSNMILELNFGDKFKIEDYDEIIHNFENDVIDGIMKNYKVTEINRVGLINRYLFQVEKLADSFINKTIGSTLEGINDINLRFSKKVPIQESYVKKDINDYINVIFNVIKKSDKKELFMSTDYQQYFDPFLTSTQQIQFKDFVSNAESFNSKNYLNWLNKNYGELS